MKYVKEFTVDRFGDETSKLKANEKDYSRDSSNGEPDLN